MADIQQRLYLALRPNNRMHPTCYQPFIHYTLPAKLVLVGVYRADPQAADAEVLARVNNIIVDFLSCYMINSKILGGIT
jgi:hypothetical protein